MVTLLADILSCSFYIHFHLRLKHCCHGSQLLHSLLLFIKDLIKTETSRHSDGQKFTETEGGRRRKLSVQKVTRGLPEEETQQTAQTESAKEKARGSKRLLAAK
jgi:hypothetical protein